MARRRRYIINGFKSGWVTNVSPTVFQAKYRGMDMLGNESWESCKNVYISPFGTIVKRLGCAKKHATALSEPPVCLHQFYTSQGNSHLLAFTPRSADASAGAFTLATSGVSAGILTDKSGVVADWTGSDIDNKVFATTFDDNLVITNGVNQPAYWDGAGGNFTAMPSTSFPADFMIPYKNFLFLLATTETGGTYRPGRARWCKPLDAFQNSSWPDSYFLDIDPDDGDKFVGAALRGGELVCFKEYKIYAINHIGGPWMFDWEERLSERGCVSGGSLVPIYNDLVFLAHDGFFKFTGNTLKEISLQIKDEVMAIHPDYRHHVIGALLEEENQVWFTIPYAGSDMIGDQDPSDDRPCNEVWVYDYVKDYWTRHNLSLAALGGWFRQTDLVMGDLTERFDSYIMSWDERTGISGTSLLLGGDYRGFISDMHAGLHDANTVKAGSSTDIDAWIKTHWIDFGDPTRTDRITRIIFAITPEGESAEWDIDVTIRTDWNSNEAGTSKTFAVSGDARNPVVEKRIDWTFQARSFQLQVGTDKGGEPFTIHEIIVEYEPKSRVGWVGPYG